MTYFALFFIGIHNFPMHSLYKSQQTILFSFAPKHFVRLVLFRGRRVVVVVFVVSNFFYHRSNEYYTKISIFMLQMFSALAIFMPF